MILVTPIIEWEVVTDNNDTIQIALGDKVNIRAKVEYVYNNMSSEYKEETHQGMITYIDLTTIRIKADKNYHIDFHKDKIIDIKLI